MRLPRKGRTLALGVVGVMLLGGIAQAHSRTYPTSLSISRSPTGVVEQLSRVTFTGVLSSDKQACVNNSVVSLVRVGHGVLAQTETRAGGGYKFVVRVSNTSRWFVKYPGEVLSSTHPHNHVCEASTSNRVRVRVG